MTGSTKLMTAGGGGVNIQPASSIASDVTVNVPSVNGTLVSTGSTAQVSQAMLASGVAGNGPAFSAYASTNQTIPAATNTKIVLNAEEWDTANCFDSVTNYRFTPNVAGYYAFNAGVVGNVTGETSLVVRKNNVLAKVIFDSNSNIFSANGGAQLYLNGSTDYAELFYYNTNGVTTSAGSAFVYFQGFLARAA